MLWSSWVKRNNVDSDHFPWRDVHSSDLSWTQSTVFRGLPEAREIL